MEACLQLNKSNCKNCYKCIRNCPVKAISFSDDRANIVKEECILCGACYVACPQNAKQIRSDIDNAKQIIQDNQRVFASIAPSFAAEFDGADIGSVNEALKHLGFYKAEETAAGAQTVKKEYERLISEGHHKVIISSCCHSVNMLIEKHYPEALGCLAKVVSPMLAHATQIKEKNENSAVIFIGPCISKKDEADNSNGLVDCVLTFEELKAWLSEKNIEVKKAEGTKEGFRSQMFPTGGGIIASMDLQEDFDYIAVDGTENCKNALNDVIDGKISNCFIEMSACAGSCIGGPVSKKSRNYISGRQAVKRLSGAEDADISEPSREKLKKEFSFTGIKKSFPGSKAIEDVLKQMGKHKKEDELNCGSCGYNTCREKAAAVLMGKAEITMCLPFLKEKAESFSDTIIGNTPNAILVMDKNLTVQQLNRAACRLFGISDAKDVLTSPVVRILDPTDYVLVMENEKNVYEKRKYLAEYKNYVEETIIYDKDYRIIISIMKDVTEEEDIRSRKDQQNKQAIEITDKVVEKQMRVVQEIASLLGETTAETKIALTTLKETLCDE